MNVSIYGPQVSPAEAAQWLQNNPKQSTNPSLRNVADYDQSGQVDAVELSTAANNGVLTLNTVHSFVLSGEDSSLRAQAESPKESGGGIHPVVGMAVSMTVGTAVMLSGKPMIGAGIFIGGSMLSIVAGNK